MSLEKVERVMDQTREGIDNQRVSHCYLHISGKAKTTMAYNRKSTKRLLPRCHQKKRKLYKLSWTNCREKL